MIVMRVIPFDVPTFESLKLPAVLGQVATKVSARTIALDPSTGRVYLPSATLAPAQRNERPKPVPGSFRVIVVVP
jgi:Tfp pilus assembly ATPase PilU